MARRESSDKPEHSIHGRWHPSGRARILALAGSVWLAVIGAVLTAFSLAAVEFKITDHPGRWFDTGTDIAGTRSLAVINPGGEVKFSGASKTVHTITSLIFPTGAVGMPFDTPAKKVSASVTPSTPGLYVFTSTRTSPASSRTV